jgi:hypothetical protein
MGATQEASLIRLDDVFLLKLLEAKLIKAWLNYFGKPILD